MVLFGHLLWYGFSVTEKWFDIYLRILVKKYFYDTYSILYV